MSDAPPLGHVYVRAPNHLGDGVMAMPAIDALAKAAQRVTVAAPGWGPTLYRDLDVDVTARGSVPLADVGVLFPPSFRVAWEARRLPRRVGVRSDLRGLLLSDALPPESPGEHRLVAYARLIQPLGLTPEGPPRFAARVDEHAAVDVPSGHIALNPYSPSGETVMWPHFRQLAAELKQPVVVYLGPGEEWDTELPVRRGLPLGALAACLERAAVLVSNDSGVAHFGRAVGVPTIVIHGSTVAERTGASGSIAVDGPDLPCRPCYAKRCRVGGVGCLDIPVEAVLAAIARLEAG